MPFLLFCFREEYVIGKRFKPVWTTLNFNVFLIRKAALVHWYVSDIKYMYYSKIFMYLICFFLFKKPAQARKQMVVHVLLLAKPVT